MIKLLITLFLLLSGHEENNEVADTMKIIKLSAAVKQVEVEKNDTKTFEITAYTAGKESTGKSPGDPEYGITASGNKVREKHTAACPPSMPFGTKLYIPHFNNTFTCEDRGSAITEGHIDIFMRSVSRAMDFGRRPLDVKVMKQDKGD